MKNFTTGILLVFGAIFFSSNFTIAQSTSSIDGNSYSPDTYLVRFDESLSNSYIDSVRQDFQCIEIFTTHLTDTRLWKFTGEYPIQLESGEWVADVQDASRKTKNRAGGGGNSGLNYKISGLPSSQALSIGAANGITPWASLFPTEPGNPDPDNPDDQMNCFGSDITNIPAGENNVHVGIYDTGGHLRYQADPGMHWHYDHDKDLIEYVNLNLGIGLDDNGHGNHVTSSLLHTVNKSGGAAAPVKYSNYKVFDNTAYANLAEIIHAFEASVISGVQIFNFSWTWRLEKDVADDNPFKESLEKAFDQYEILVICAAGNNGNEGQHGNLEIDAQDFGGGIPGNTGNNGDKDDSNLSSYPASYDFDNILTVMTHDCNGFPASFSNYDGETVDISAPGIDIPGKFVSENGLNQAIDYKSGTSMSTAIVSGVAASLATHQDQFDAMEIKCAIINGAEEVLGLLGKNVAGGILDADNALSMLGNCEFHRYVELPQSNGGSSFAVYPNPTSGEININVESTYNDEIFISIYDQIGKLVLLSNQKISKGINGININGFSLESGSYTVSMKYNDKVENQKLVVIK